MFGCEILAQRVKITVEKLAHTTKKRIPESSNTKRSLKAKPKSQLNVSETQKIIHAESVKKSKGVGTGMEQDSDSGYKPATLFTCYPSPYVKNNALS